MMPPILRLAELRATALGFEDDVAGNHVAGDSPARLLRSLARDVWWHYNHAGGPEDLPVYQQMEQTYLRLARVADRL